MTISPDGMYLWVADFTDMGSVRRISTGLMYSTESCQACEPGSAGVVNSDGDARDWRQGIVLGGLEGSASFSERSSELATC